MQIIAILVGVLLLAALAFYISRPLVSARHVVPVRDITSLEVQREAIYSQVRELDMDHATGKTNDEDYQRIRTELVAQAAAVLKKIDGVAQSLTVEPARASAPAPAVSDDDLEGLIAARRKVKPAVAAVKPNADDLEAVIAARRKSSPAVAKADRDIEAAIAARRKTPSAAAKADQDIEALIAARRKGSPTVAKVGAGQDRRTGDKVVGPAVAAPISSARTCPKCNSPVAANDAFCAKCGTTLACPKCGKPIRPGDAFCSKCGTALQPQATS